MVCSAVSHVILIQFLLLMITWTQASIVSTRYNVKVKTAISVDLEESMPCAVKCRGDSSCHGFYVNQSSSENGCFLFTTNAAFSASVGDGAYFSMVHRQEENCQANAQASIDYDNHYSNTHLPRSCEDWKISQGGTLPVGIYKIDPDGIDGVEPFEVKCITNGQTWSQVLHDRLNEVLINGKSGYEPAYSYNFSITYGPEDAQIRALVMQSNSCRMRVVIKCYHSVIAGFTAWVGYDGTKHKMEKESTVCQGSSTKPCKCDLNDAVWRTDSGYITTDSQFPVKALLLGDLGHSGEYHKIAVGPIECEGVASELPCDIPFATRYIQYTATGVEIVYTCFPGLVIKNIPVGPTQITKTRQPSGVWSANNYMECDFPN